MKTKYSILSPLLILILLTSTITLSPKQSKCKVSPQFQADLDTGIVKIFRAGGRSWSDTYVRLMHKNYRLNIIETDLFVLTPEMDCYNSFSIPYVNKKYGDTIFDDMKRLAIEMDKDGRGDRQANMEVKMDSVLHFLYQRVNPKLYAQYLNDKNKVLQLYTYFYVDTLGQIYDLYESGVKGSDLDSTLKSMAKTIPFKAKPAIDNGEKANGIVFGYINLGAYSDSVYKAFHE